MSIYRCEYCDNMKDDDYSPMAEAEVWRDTPFTRGVFVRKLLAVCAECKIELDEEDDDE